ncbi:hypothetical protein JX265_008529 [Neoarthrinium moseri]|uniref:Copper homeostasis protein cutC homolog n=1 Tax=Neoarthrinium moseri TaxID=1658444 RepID=A0A9P9WHH7_9PEZI|nr:uncharacterized protein JN550_013482 [Neoarthrinium moseri]KAI1840103.1 hypothetical protein JX266_013685 [Neoarthrinium moseri]KAI1857038.1 hypothetical protein JN550_013482 [Neoarthrinium moseri]KAI1864158.1 hypothetical protein JX265_008529 [Neoarthrinium moseri]
MSTRLEIPVFGAASAATAILAGASRIELNAEGSYADGGLTPRIKDIAQLESLVVPVRVMIRPRGPPSSGGLDFVYSRAELDTMEQAIRDFKASGMMSEPRGDGFVFGVLNAPNAQAVVGTDASRSRHAAIDVDSCRRLVNAARPFKAVFHRAFDEVVGRAYDADTRALLWESGLGDLIAVGFDGILTSGGLGNALENVETLDRIFRKAGDGVEVIIGGGIRSTNVGHIRRTLGLGSGTTTSWMHSSCITVSGSEQVDGNEVKRILEELR